jgi:hypothetical protein
MAPRPPTRPQARPQPPHPTLRALSPEFIKAYDLCEFCWANPLPAHDQWSNRDRWTCTCSRTKCGKGAGKGGKSDKRKHDTQGFMMRKKKSQEEAMNPIK